MGTLGALLVVAQPWRPGAGGGYYNPADFAPGAQDAAAPGSPSPFLFGHAAPKAHHGPVHSSAAYFSAAATPQRRTSAKHADHDAGTMHLPSVLEASPSPMPAKDAAAVAAARVKVGSWYVLGGVRDKVVRVVNLSSTPGYVAVSLYTCTRSKSSSNKPGSVKFLKDQSDNVEVPVSALTLGPFQVTAGRAPGFIHTYFHEQVAATGGLDGESPSALHTGEAKIRGLSGMDPRKLITSESRFRYPRSLTSLLGMGFADRPELREVITRHEGRVQGALGELMSPSYAAR